MSIVNYDDELQWMTTGIFNKNTAIPERLKYISDNSPQQFDDSLRCLMLYPNLHMTQKIKLRSKIPPGANILFNKGLWYWNTGYPDYSDNQYLGEVQSFTVVTHNGLPCVKVILKAPKSELIWLVEQKSKLVFEVNRTGTWESERNTWEYYDYIDSKTFIMRKYGVVESQKSLIGYKLTTFPSRVWEAGQFIKIMEADQSSSAVIIDETNIESVIAGITYYIGRLDYYTNVQKLPSDAYYIRKTKAYIDYYKAVLAKLYILEGTTVGNITNPLGVTYTTSYASIINSLNVPQITNIVNTKYNELINIRPLSTEEIIFAKLQRVQYFGSTRIHFNTGGTSYSTKSGNKSSYPEHFESNSNYTIQGSNGEDELLGQMSYQGTGLNSSVSIDIAKFFNIEESEVGKYNYRIQVSFGGLRNSLNSPGVQNIYFYNTLSATKPVLVLPTTSNPNLKPSCKSTVNLYIERAGNQSLDEIRCSATLSLFATRKEDFKNI